jgi:sugar lactone lactonase YvrE
MTKRSTLISWRPTVARNVIRVSMLPMLVVCLATTTGLFAQAQNTPATNSRVETVATIPSSGPTENICQAKDGTFYVTGIDDRILWKINPSGTVEKFVEMPSLAGFLGVATNNKEILLISFGKPFRRPAPAAAPGAPPAPGNADFSDVDPAIQVLNKSGKVVATIPGQKGQAYNGMALAGKDWYLAADSNASSVWRIDPGKKKIELWIKNDVFARIVPPVPGGANGGANGIKVHNGFAYIGSQGAIYRVKIGPGGKADGAPVKFAEVRYDDFAIAPDGTLYGPVGNTIMKVSPTGEVSKFLDNVPTGPAAWVTQDGKWLYWPTRGGTAPQHLVRVAIP